VVAHAVEANTVVESRRDCFCFWWGFDENPGE